MHISLIKSVDLLIKEGYCPHGQIPSGETKTLNMWLPGVWNLVDEARFYCNIYTAEPSGVTTSLKQTPTICNHLYSKHQKINVPSQSLIVNDSSRIFHCFHSLLSDHHGTIKFIVPWSYLPTLPVFPGVSKFFIKSPGFPVTAPNLLDKMDFWAFLCFSLKFSPFFHKIRTFCIHCTVSGTFLHMFSQWQRLVRHYNDESAFWFHVLHVRRHIMS